MISYLRLANWRAFDALELEFEPGTTFVVSPNGVGKTSLILALAWGVFGDHQAVSGRDSIRAGAASTEVEVGLELADGRLMSIVRRCTSGGRVKSTFVIAGVEVDESEATAALEESFGVELGVAAKLAVMLGGGLLAAEKALDLRDHLYKAFGVADLLQAASDASAIAKVATKDREALRTAGKKHLEDRTAVERQLRELEMGLEAERAKRSALESELEVVKDERHLLEAWEAVDARSRQGEVRLAALGGEISELIGDVKRRDAIDVRVDEAHLATENQIRDLTDRMTEGRSRELAAEHALELLHAADGATCPTCLRPFHGVELDTAKSRQEEAAAQAAAHAQQLEQELRELRRRLSRLNDLLRSVSQLPPPPEHPERERPEAESLDARTSAATEALRLHDTSIGRLEAERDTFRQALAEVDSREKEEAELLTAYRKEAAAIAAADALAEAARQATAHRIDPLVNEVQWRWKQLFGREGIELRPDGSIVLIAGDRELPWSALSGGERIWARLVTQLLLLAASTRMPFAWFDEPLEHLDPRARRAVAGALAAASGAGAPKQLIVTTYEHAIARQLATDLASTSVMHVRRSEDRAPDDDHPVANKPPRRVRVRVRDAPGGELDEAQHVERPQA
jgi:DNA repair exonuclease SbcCD ATPase subunit